MFTFTSFNFMRFAASPRVFNGKIAALIVSSLMPGVRPEEVVYP